MKDEENLDRQERTALQAEGAPQAKAGRQA